MNSLLPANATPLERALEMALRAPVDAIPAPQRSLWNPDTCPEALLPVLAAAVSTDEWDPDWTEDRKRAAIRASIGVHRVKGTAGAVRQGLAALDYVTRVVEWFHESPPAPRATFAVEADIDARGITPGLYAELERIALSAKNVRSHLRRVSLVARSSGHLYIGGPLRFARRVTLHPAGAIA